MEFFHPPETSDFRREPITSSLSESRTDDMLDFIKDDSSESAETATPTHGVAAKEPAYNYDQALEDLVQKLSRPLMISKASDAGASADASAANTVLQSEMYKLEQKHLSAFYVNCKRRYEVKPKDKLWISPEDKIQVSEGEKKLQEFEDILYNGFSWKLHNFQRGFAEKAVIALAPSIVGDDWGRDGPRIIKERGWETPSQMVMAKAPRRFGKTAVVAMLVIAYAEVMPRTTQAIFSTGRRASKNLLDICHKFALERGFRPGIEIEHFNQEELWIRNPRDPREATKIMSYPANAKISLLVVLLFLLKQEQADPPSSILPPSLPSIRYKR